MLLLIGKKPISVREIQNFNTIASPLIECLKRVKFNWCLKKSGARSKWSTYEKKLYALIPALKKWEHYLLSKEFVLLIDHFSLKYLQVRNPLPEFMRVGSSFYKDLISSLSILQVRIIKWQTL